MRRSPLKKTPDKSRTVSKSRLSQSRTVPRPTSHLYYYHYRNAMYMGGIRSFKKDGRGILLHDCGLSVITSYHNDLMHGHNIFFDNYSLFSAIFSKNKVVEAVYRIEGFLAHFTYNQEGALQGKIKLINFVTKTIIYAFFKRGVMMDKTEQTDPQLLNRIFDLNQLEILIGRTHANTINYQFQKTSNIQCQKTGNKIVIGFEKNSCINGLGFQFVIRGSQGGYNPDTQKNEDSFELQMAERGYYMNTQLNGMGEKVFKNGNFYIGQFKNGIFQGNGILKNTNKQNWVSGYFKEGNLVELLEYNSEGSGKAINKIVEAFHERKTNWINNQIHLIDLNFYVDEIEKIITNTPKNQVQNLQQRKLEVLRKIQEKFITDNGQSFNDQIEGSIQQLKNTAGNSSVSKFIHSFAPPSEEQRKPYVEKASERNKLEESKKDQELKEANFQRKSQPKSPFKMVNFTQGEMRKIQKFNPGWAHRDNRSQSKKREPLFRSQSKAQNISSNQWSALSKYQIERSRNRVGGVIGEINESSSDRSSFNSGNLDSKRMISKNKIFKYLQSQEEKGSPQFTYNKVDTLRDNQR